MGTIVYGPCLLLGSGRIVSTALATGWVGTTIAGVLVGKSRTSGAGNSGSAPGGASGFVVKLLVAVAPTVFLLGLLAAGSLAVAMVLREGAVEASQAVEGLHEASREFLSGSFVSDRRSAWTVLGSLLGTLTAARTLMPSVNVDLFALDAMHVSGAFLNNRGSIWVVIGALGAVVGAACVVLPFVNVNLFSLHAMYANRLTRAFLGASRRKSDWGQRWSAKEDNRRVLAGAPTARRGEIERPTP